MYDLFILCLMTAAILTVLVSSFKIFRSRVYPIGMVRKVPVPSKPAEILPEFSSEDDFQEELLRFFLDKGCSNSEAFENLYLSERGVKDFQQARLFYTKQRLWPKSKLAFRYHRSRRDPLDEHEDTAISTEDIVKHGEVRKLNAKVENMEKRIRQLEIESLEKVQAAIEEQTPQVPLVH